MPALTHIGALRSAAATWKADTDLAEEEAAAEWEAIEAARSEAEEPIIGSLRQMFDEQRRIALERLPSELTLILPAKSPLFDIAALLVDGLWDTWLEEIMGEGLAYVLEAGYEVGSLRIDFEPSNYNPSPRSIDVLRAVIGKTRGVNTTTKEALAQIIRDGLYGGKTIAEITADVDRQFEEWSTWRAATIAQTAATGTFELGQADAYRDAGLTEHYWLSSRDGRVRLEHLYADGKKVEIGKYFPMGPADEENPRAGLPTFPGDPLALPEYVIGCRCSTRPAKRKKPAAKFDALTGGMNQRERDRVAMAVRDRDIRLAYPQLREAKGATAAIVDLADRYAVSESTAKTAIWGR